MNGVSICACLFGLVLLPPAGAHAQAPADTLFVRSSGPNLEFMPDRVSAKQGTRVILRYVNGGDLPHNLVIVRDDDDLDAVVAAAYGAQATGFIPTDLQALLVAHTPLVSPGQTAAIEFVVPPPGEYTYICLVPGHSNMMLGVLRALR